MYKLILHMILKFEARKKMNFLSIILLSIFGLTLGGDVVHLNDGNYADFIRKNENVFVMYYRKLNDYCSTVLIRFEDAAYSSTEASFAQIDCSRGGKKTCKRLGKRGKPDFVFFKQGIPVGELRDNFHTPTFLEFVQEMMKDNIVRFKNEEDLEKHFDKYPETTFSVGYFHENSNMKHLFTKMADKLRQYLSFATVTHDTDERKGEKVAIYLPKAFRNPEESKYYAYPDVSDEKELYSWYMRNMHLTVRIRTPKNAWQFHGAKNPAVIVYYRYNFSEPSSVKLRHEIHVVSQSFFMNFDFYLCSPIDFPQELLEYGIQEIANVQNAILTVKYKNRKYMMTSPFTVKNAQNFMKDLMKGEVKPFIISEQVISQTGLIKRVVGDNIEPEIEQEKRDILMFFYLPWCPKSKKLEKTLEELAMKLKGESIVVMKMDASSNDIPYPILSHIENYPVLFWIPNSKIYPMVVYNGPDDVNDMFKYVIYNATNELKLYTRHGRRREEL